MALLPAGGQPMIDPTIGCLMKSRATTKPYNSDERGGEMNDESLEKTDSPPPRTPFPDGTVWAHVTLDGEYRGSYVKENGTWVPLDDVAKEEQRIIEATL